MPSPTVVTDDKARPGPSAPRTETPRTPTGIPVIDIGNELGPIGDTYDQEYGAMVAYLRRTGNMLGPVAPVVFVDHARRLYRLALEVTADRLMSPRDKCVLLFRIFDAIVLSYKNIGFVYSNDDGTRSVYGYSETVLKNLLSRIEVFAGRVANAVHDTYSLTVLNEVVASAEQRLSQVRTEKDMTDFFRTVSGGPQVGVPTDSVTRAAGVQMPHGIEKYESPFVEVSVLLRRLYERSGSDYARDLHDTIYLVATANAPTTLAGALETRMVDKDRNVVLLEVPGDRTFATSLCASAIGFLCDTLRERTAGSRGVGDSGLEEYRQSPDVVETYRINYGRVFSKYRGESERNFSRMMDWIKDTVRGGDKFRVFWFPDIENLMAPRTSNDQEHIATIKNAMLQHMDDFNKDRTLRSFLLLFNASEGALDSAFSRRLETVIRTPTDPLCDPAVAAQAVGAELARYHINMSDDAVQSLVVQAAAVSSDRHETRIGGFAYVRAALRDMYVNQKLALKYGTPAVNRKVVSEDVFEHVFGRYLSQAQDGGGRIGDVLYDLDGRLISDYGTIARVAFTKDSYFASFFGERHTASVRYNSSVRGDPKDMDGRDAARTIFVHDILDS